MSLVVATFYKFVALPDVDYLKPSILKVCRQQEIKGTILLATEGINGTISGSCESVAAVVEFLRSDTRLADLEVKQSTAQTHPMRRLKVKIKDEIVTIGLKKVDPNRQVGTYVRPQDWNQLISDPEVLVIDTRNEYEVNIGTFKGALNPQTQSFRQFPQYAKTHLDPKKYKKVAMFCTGGIRCEKASSYLISQGFEQVYHLQGGILKYLEQTPQSDSLWQGECFVFDERVSVQHGLAAGSYQICYGCGYPVSESDRSSPHYIPGICCPHCYEKLTEDKQDRLQRRLEGRKSDQNQSFTSDP